MNFRRFPFDTQFLQVVLRSSTGRQVLTQVNFSSELVPVFAESSTPLSPLWLLPEVRARQPLGWEIEDISCTTTFVASRVLSEAPIYYAASRVNITARQTSTDMIVGPLLYFLLTRHVETFVYLLSLVTLSISVCFSA